MICRKCKSEVPPEDIIEEVIRLVSLAQRVKQRERSGPVRQKITRQFLFEWLATWRSDQGIEDTSRPLKNRGTTQLQRMYEQALKGRNYRLGRRWGGGGTNF